MYNNCMFFFIDNIFQLFKNESFLNMDSAKNPQMSSSTSNFQFNFN